MQEHLIIDGNNALHAIPELAVEFAKDRNLEEKIYTRVYGTLTNYGK